jgi:hypothetical protein
MGNRMSAALAFFRWLILFVFWVIFRTPTTA